MYFEEFFVGQRFELNPVTLTNDDIYDFASRFDPQPIHIDQEYSEQSAFGGIIASGFHTVSIIWGEWIRANRFGKEIIVGTGMDYIRWTAPVRALDTLYTNVEIIETTPSPKGKRGMVVLKFTSTNQDDQAVLHMQGRAYLKMQ